jgi:transmembrane sensor
LIHMPSHADDPDRHVAQTAAEWVTRRDRGLTPPEQLAFDAWRAADPRHEIEMERLGATWRDLDSIRSAPELEAMADAVVSRARAAQRHRRRLRFVAGALSAAAALAVAFVAWDRYSLWAGGNSAVAVTENYRVIASTMERTVLPDGSVAELNGPSRIELDFTPAERRVRLVEGEAHFVVVPDADRPFFVTAGPVTVRAVGTAFNVRFENASVEVLVTEGKVKLQSAGTEAVQQAGASLSDEAPALVQGQRAVISLSATSTPANVAIAEVNSGEIIDSLGWQSTRLVFSNTPLDEVVAGFNQYNAHQLRLGDSRLRSRTLTGEFRADNLEGFVRLLRASVDVRAERQAASEIVLLPMR